jgi:hypothetical protein
VFLLVQKETEMAQNIPAKTMFLQIGKRRYQVASFENASQMFCKARDASGYGASKIKSPLIVDENGVPIARVSYNGRVWAGAEYVPDAVPLYPIDGGYID